MLESGKLAVFTDDVSAPPPTTSHQGACSHLSRRQVHWNISPTRLLSHDPDADGLRGRRAFILKEPLGIQFLQNKS